VRRTEPKDSSGQGSSFDLIGCSARDTEGDNRLCLAFDADFAEPPRLFEHLTFEFAEGEAGNFARTSEAAQQKSTSKTAVKKKATYSASASAARKERLARARAAARSHEQSRMRVLQTAMTPRFKTDASGALVPDIRAAAAILQRTVRCAGV